jgi:hypothetical protein
MRVTIMSKQILTCLAIVAILPAVLHAQAQGNDSDYKLLQGVGLKTEGVALLDYFRQRTFKEPDPAELARLFQQLGSDSFAARNKAHQELLRMGPPVVAGLKAEENKANLDTEVRVRIQDVRDQIMAKVDPSIQAATARLIGALKPDGAAEILLGYIPFAPNQSVVDELCTAVSAVAMKNGKPDPAVIKSLTDANNYKRIAAAEALMNNKDKEHLPAIRKLLKDEDDHVRLRVGLALVVAREKEALPVLIELLAAPKLDRLWQVEEILVRLAGSDAPEVSLGNTDEARKKCRDAWQDWLTKQGDKLDLAKLDQPQNLLGYTLIVQQSLNRIVNGQRMQATGQIVELDAQKKERWKFEVNTYPVDAQVTRQDRVLVAEYHGARVTERDFKGDIKWEQAVGGNPIGVQGLANDHIFVVMQNRLVEYDRDHKEVFSFNRPGNGGEFFRARKMRNGDVVFITNAGQCTRIESARQTTIKTFQVGNIPVLFGNIDVLPDGGVIVPDFNQSRVVEYDAEGKIRKQFQVQWPNSVMRLPNGNTLVGSQNTRMVIEFDRTGQQVSSYNTDGMVFNARRR